MPWGLQAIIRGCLAKAPGERYQRASEVRAALEAVGWSSSTTVEARGTDGRNWRALVKAAVFALAGALVWWWRTPAKGAGPHARVHSIAVRRSRNVRPCALISSRRDDRRAQHRSRTDQGPRRDLAHLGEALRNSTKRLPRLRELSVDAIIQGSVLRDGNRVRISAQLIDAAADRHLWANDMSVMCRMFWPCSGRLRAPSLARSG